MYFDNNWAVVVPMANEEQEFAPFVTALIDIMNRLKSGSVYFVVDNAALAMGNFGGYPPLIAAWAPFMLFALVGETVLVRTEE